MREAENDSQAKTLSSRLLLEFRERILSGELAEGTRLPPELEIARTHGVSRGTVRQVLGTLVNEGLLERIRGSGTFVRHAAPPSTIQESKSQPYHHLHKSVGLILSQASDELNMGILVGVEQAIKPRGYQLSFAYAEDDPAHLAMEIERLQTTTDGLVIFPVGGAHHNRPILQQLREKGVPFVLVDRYVSGVDCDYVTSDNLGGGYRATEHLLILGYSRIAFVTEEGLDVASVQERWLGYRKALQEYQQPFDESLTYVPPPERHHFYDSLVTGPNRPDAIFAVNDSIALEIMRTAQRHGLRVPEDVAVVGFDNRSFAALLSTPLTTVAQQYEEMGNRAGTLLINRIEGLVAGAPKHIELPVNLVIRQSCGARLRVSRIKST